MFPPETKILVADDMPTIRDLVKNQLKVLGYKNIVEASDGEHAMRILLQGHESQNPVQLVISDWNMPRMSGLEFLKKCRSSSQWRQLPFILLTSESERDQVTEAILSGVSQYIVKPFAAKIFQEKLKSTWDKHHP